jgi:hypothetical protein
LDHTRHLNIYNIPQFFSVGVVGAGGIGAITALGLAKMGVVQMTVWDDDTVSSTNIPTQLHPVSDVGMPKVDSLQQTLERFSDEILFNGVKSRVDFDTDFDMTYDLLIAAVDSIEARQDIWGAVCRSRVEWYLDTRMGAEEYQHFLVDMHDPGVVERYDKFLHSFTDKDLPEVPCTSKATFYTALGAGQHVGTALRNIIKGEAKPHRLVHYIAPADEIQHFYL